MLEDQGWVYGTVIPVRKFKCWDCGCEFYTINEEDGRYCTRCGSLNAIREQIQREIEVTEAELNKNDNSHAEKMVLNGKLSALNWVLSIIDM